MRFPYILLEHLKQELMRTKKDYVNAELWVDQLISSSWYNVTAAQATWWYFIHILLLKK
jgi:hypothetical protein